MINPFKLRRERPQSNNAKPSPFGLSDADLNRLRELRASDSFPLYLQLLDRLSILHGDFLLVSADNVGVHFERGFISALKVASALVDETLSKADELDKHSEPAAADPDRRTISTYATPFWRA